MSIQPRDIHSFNHEKVKKLLQKEYEGYVLVTARKSDNPEKLEVELSYEGDAALASYLVVGAQSVLDDCIKSELELEEEEVHDARPF